jgi:hypothetical protein
MQDNTFSTKQDLHFSEKLDYWFDSFKFFANKNRFSFLFFDSPQMEMRYFENYYSIQERMEFIKGFMAFDEINHYIKITFNCEKSRCEGFLTELRQSVERLEFSKTECWLKSMIENFENENTKFDSDIAPPATYQMMHELYYLWNDAVSDCNKIFALYSNLPDVLPPQLFNQMNTPLHQTEGKTNNRTIEKNKRYLDITTMYYTQIDNGEKINTSKKNTMTKNGISKDTFKRALKENIEILRTKGRENDFKWLKIN